MGQSLSAGVIDSAAASAGEGTQPHPDAFADEHYKRHMVTVYARRALEKAAERAER